MLTRRRFIALSATAAAAAGLAPGTLAGADAAKGKGKGGLRILVLGGSKFLGPAIIEVALERGHTVSMFNRGRTNPGIFPSVEKLIGDRDPKKGQGIKALEGRTWDAVIDDSGYYPRMVGATAKLLAPSCGQYVYVSSISAYRDTKKEGMDEDYPLATMPDPTLENMGKNYEYYGALKALCEREAQAAFGARATIVRPGYIVGPNDPTDRFTYWPVRAAQGGEMLAPGTPKDPIQVIDVRDLGRFMVGLVEKRTPGVFNATGPEKPLTMGAVIEESLAATGRKATPVWVPASFLRAKGENGEGNIPIWAPYEDPTKGYHTCSVTRAMKAGLTFRPMPETLRDTLAWFRTLPAERQATLKAGIPDEAAWLAEFKKS